MDVIYTTLNQIKEHNPCRSGWEKLLKNLGGLEDFGAGSPLTFKQIYKSNGCEHTHWALRVIDSKYYPLLRHFAIDAAKQVEYLMEDERSLKALEVARRFADGLATDKEMQAAWVAARDAVRVSARGVAKDAARGVAKDAARAAACASVHVSDAVACAVSDTLSDAAVSDRLRDATFYAAWVDLETTTRHAVRVAQMRLLFEYCRLGKRPENSVELLAQFIKEETERVE